MALDLDDPLTLTIPVTVTLNFHADLNSEATRFLLTLDQDTLLRTVNQVVRAGLHDTGIPAMLRDFDGAPSEIIGLTLDTATESE